MYLIKMNRKASFASLIMALVVWSDAGSATNRNRLVSTSSAILPPLPDLPIPGTQIKVIGNPRESAEELGKEDSLKPMAPRAEPKVEEKSLVGVFEAERAPELVY